MKKILWSQNSYIQSSKVQKFIERIYHMQTAHFVVKGFRVRLFNFAFEKEKGGTSDDEKYLFQAKTSKCILSRGKK